MNGEDGRNLIFIIGLPRSGTTLLQTLLSRHPEIFTYSESWILLHPLLALKEGKLIAPAYGAESYIRAVEDLIEKSEHGRSTYLEAVQKMADTLYTSCLRASGKRFFLDKSPPYYLVMQEIAQLFPQAKIIVLLRNPLAILNSITNTWFNGRCSKILTCPVHCHSIFLGPQLIADGLKALGTRCIVIKYENLVMFPNVEISKICKHLGIHVDQGMFSYEERPGGRLGDSKITKHSKPIDSSLIDWLCCFEKYANYQFALSYLEYLGPDLFSSLDYDYELIRKMLVERWEQHGALTQLGARILHVIEALKSFLYRSFYAAKLAFQIEGNVTWEMYFYKFPPFVPDFSSLEGLDALKEPSIIERLKRSVTITSYWQEGPPRKGRQRGNFFEK